jgi:hypothetical protein
MLFDHFWNKFLNCTNKKVSLFSGAHELDKRQNAPTKLAWRLVVQGTEKQKTNSNNENHNRAFVLPVPGAFADPEMAQMRRRVVVDFHPVRQRHNLVHRPVHHQHRHCASSANHQKQQQQTKNGQPCRLLTTCEAQAVFRVQNRPMRSKNALDARKMKKRHTGMNQAGEARSSTCQPFSNKPFSCKGLFLPFQCARR